ncbi:MAG: ABC transporter ATP-binding protein [Gemmatirosa sp.]|nr:ABC transporter ATP-binding protein [Gemmatirosa sp.]
MTGTRVTAPDDPLPDDVAIRFDGVGKSFPTYASPLDRLKEALHPLGRRYHTPLSVLRDVGFTIRRGETVGVLGPNGVGKSTMLHLAAGLVEPSTGTVAVRGRVLGLFDLAGGFAPELTGRENVRFFHEVVRGERGNWADHAREIADFAELGDDFDRPVRAYSSGMFLRLAFANALAADPDVLLVDEVIAVGDVRFQQKCYQRIRELRGRGVTILIVTHLVESVRSLLDRVLLLDHGALVYDGDAIAGIDRYYQLYFTRRLAEPPADLSSAEPGAGRRYGSGGARITRTVAADEAGRPALHFQRGGHARVVMDVEFARDVAEPHYGVTCTTTEGVCVYSTTTALLRQQPAPAAAGERRRVEIAFALPVAVADLFVDLSVFEQDHGAITVLDARSRAVHLTVAVPADRLCHGTTDLVAAFHERLVGDAHAGACAD